MLIERKVYKETVVSSQIKLNILNSEIVKANRLNDEKNKLIGVQTLQINDLNLMNTNCDQNIALMKKEISNQKRKKFVSTVKWVGATMAITATVVSLLK